MIPRAQQEAAELIDPQLEAVAALGNRAIGPDPDEMDDAWTEALRAELTDCSTDLEPF